MKKILSIFLIIILALSACATSDTVSNENESDSILNQVLKSRESAGDTVTSTVHNMSNTETDNKLSDDNTNDSTSITSWKDLEQLGPVGQGKKRSYDEIKEQYPDKIIITINGISPADFITDTLNEYLVQNGCNYVVYFNVPNTIHDADQRSIISNDEIHLSEENKKLLDELLISNDIICMYRNLYFDLSRKGYLESLNSYLSTEKGQELYQSLPDSNWKLCYVEGEIYGINNRADIVLGPPSYIVNRELMNKYNISEEALNKPIYELEAVLKQVAEGEKANADFRPLVIDVVYYFSVFNNSPYLNSSAVALYNDITKNAGSVLDDPENLHWLKALWKYANQGMVGKISDNLNDFFIKVNSSSSLPYMIPDYMYIYNKEGELADSDEVTEIVLNKFYASSLFSNRLYMHANCITAASKHKAEAFDFLMKLNTDPYITNLLTYGIENKTYVMKDGKVDWPDIYNMGYGNAYISYPRIYEYADKKTRYWELNEKLSDNYCDFVFDPTSVKNELYKTNQVMQKVSDILSGNVTDFDAFITDIRKQLDDNGLPRLLEEVNRQIEEWLESKEVAMEK